MFNEVINKSAVRAPYNKVFNWAEALPKNTILKKQIQAENLFKKIGVTFSVYNIEGNNLTAKYVALFTTVVNFLISFYLWISFDQSSCSFQFI